MRLWIGPSVLLNVYLLTGRAIMADILYISLYVHYIVVTCVGHFIILNKRQRKPKGKSRMDNPKTQATLDASNITKTNNPRPLTHN